MANLTLLREGHPLADPSCQRAVLQRESGRRPFVDALSQSGLDPLRSETIQVLQLNLGKLCNMTCRHCHVDAGPDRREIMTREVADACLRALAATNIPTLDLTGGAPEMNPNFPHLVTQARSLGRHVIDRCNLTILQAPGYSHLPSFLADQQVELVASLPCYLEQNVDAQRGEHAFHHSLDALRHLNSLGYGQPDSGLILTLVYNPLGPTLPPDQAALVKEYRRELAQRHGVQFSRLITITNMPISRFLHQLLQAGDYAQYMERLIGAYNPAAARAVMCRTTLSVDWEGRLYDCDFNQMLGLSVRPDVPQHIGDFDVQALATRRIVTGQHCYGCTAGAGSSCQGALI